MPPQGKSVCPFQNCNREFTERGLRIHIRSHQASEPIPCSVTDCRQTFATISEKNAHVQAAHNGTENGSTPDATEKELSLTCQIEPLTNNKVSLRDDSSDDDSGVTGREDIREIVQNGEYLASQLAIAKVSMSSTAIG